MSHEDSTFPEGSRPIPGTANYCICDGGVVWSNFVVGGKGRTGPWRIHKLKKHKSGHLKAEMRIGGKPLGVYVHHLVIEAFKEPRPPGLECRHKDGNPANNFASNLEWGTTKSNADDREEHGRTAKGEDVGNSKLLEADIREIFRLASQRLTQGEIGEIYGVTQSSICVILNGKRWKHIRDHEIGDRRRNAKIADKDIPEIFRLQRGGSTVKEIAAIFSVGVWVIYNVLQRKTWKHVPI